MKRFLLFSLIAVFILMMSTTALAAEVDKRAKGTLKVDWLTFTDDFLDDTDSKEALYVGLDMRSPLTDYYDIGMEIGYVSFTRDITGPAQISGRPGTFTGTWENDLLFIPVEVYISYSRDFGNLVYTLGAGFSGTFVKYGVDVNDLGVPFTYVDEESGWLKGAQAFFDLSYNGEVFFFGIDGKYHVVEGQEYFNKWLDINFSNFRTGLHVGSYF